MRTSRARATWLLLGVFTAAFAIIPQAATAQFTPYSHDPTNILEGNWQSCREHTKEKPGRPGTRGTHETPLRSTP